MTRPDIKDRSLAHLWGLLEFYLATAESGRDPADILRDMARDVRQMPEWWAAEGRDWPAEMSAIRADIRRWQNEYRVGSGLEPWPAETGSVPWAQADSVTFRFKCPICDQIDGGCGCIMRSALAGPLNGSSGEHTGDA